MGQVESKCASAFSEKLPGLMKSAEEKAGAMMSSQTKRLITFGVNLRSPFSAGDWRIRILRGPARAYKLSAGRFS